MTSPDYEGLAELLLSLESETDSHPQKGRRLVNPDGPEAAAALRTAVAERDRLEEAAREGLICAEADLENELRLCEEWDEDPETDYAVGVFRKRRDLIAAALSGRKEP